jgi:serine/threonine-protein kinase ULK/ATG1
MIEDEIKILTNLNSPYIVKLYDVQKTVNHIYLILEYCKDGNLKEFLDK